MRKLAPFPLHNRNVNLQPFHHNKKAKESCGVETVLSSENPETGRPTAAKADENAAQERAPAAIKTKAGRPTDKADEHAAHERA